MKTGHLNWTSKSKSSSFMSPLLSVVVQENPEFDLHFEKVYRWVASSTAEKNSFISCIWKLNQRYTKKKLEFVNVSSQLLEGERAAASL